MNTNATSLRNVQRLDRRDIQELQRQTPQLRQRLLLAIIEHCTSLDAALQLWSNLKPAERNDREIVYK
jgi:hypothetical protein